MILCDQVAFLAETGDDKDKKLEAMQNTPASHQSLAEALIEQLVILELSQDERALAEYRVDDASATISVGVGERLPPRKVAAAHSRDREALEVEHGCVGVVRPAIVRKIL